MSHISHEHKLNGIVLLKEVLSCIAKGIELIQVCVFNWKHMSTCWILK